MNYLNEFKTSLDNTYKNLDNIESFGIDISEFKKRIEDFDKVFDRYDTNSNTAVQVKYTREQKRDLNAIYKTIKILEKQIIDLNSALSLITYLKEIKPTLDIYTTKEDTLKIVEQVLNKLLLFVQNKNIINIELLDDEIDTLYQIIKYEYKYTGQSSIMYYMFKNDLLTHKFFEVWENDCKENDLIASFKSPYYLNDTIFRRAINEDGYLSSVKVPLKEIYDRYVYEESIKSNKQNEIKENKETNKIRNKKIREIYSGFIPMILSLSMLIGANVGSYSIVKSSSPYKTRTEIYSTINDETTIEEGYSKLQVGDETVTIYYPTDEKGARIIKKYDIDDYENFDITTANFTSSEYKVDNESNNVSTNQYMTVEKVIEIDENDKKLNVPLEILSSILFSGIVIFLDVLTNRQVGYDKNIHTLTSLLYLDDIYYRIKKEMISINKNYPKKDLKEIKKSLKELKRVINKIKKEYEQEYDKHAYMSKYLEEDGYIRKLK